MGNNQMLTFALLAAVVGSSVGLSADMLRLKNGQSMEGTYLGGNSRSIRFEVSGATRYYSVEDVDQIQFTGTPVAQVRFVPFSNGFLSMKRPDTWLVRQNGGSWTIAPAEGRVGSRTGNPTLAYGVTTEVFDMDRAPNDPQFPSRNGYGLRRTLREDTDFLIDDLRQNNRNLRVVSQPESIRIDGRSALSMRLTNGSPVGGLETNWLITTRQPDGLLYIIFTAPDRQFSRFEPVFRQMLDSIRLNR